MTTNKSVMKYGIALTAFLSLWAIHPAVLFAQDTGPAPGASSPPAAPLPPDLTPSGYKSTDPLYNDPEVKMGRLAVDEINKEARFCQDKAIVARVQAIGAKIAAVADVTQVSAGFGNDKVVPYHYTYHVIDSKEVNAFSLPGGSIYIYKGMLDLITSDDELAGVLGHETAHAAHHHVSTLTKEANKMSSDMLLAAVVAILGHAPVGDVLSVYTGASYAAQGIQNNVFSEHAEEDADHTGMIFMQKAGYNPVGMLTMLDRLEQVEKESPDIDMGFLQDHPLTPDRVAAAKAELATLGVPVTANSVRQADNSLPVTVIPAVSTSSKTVTLQVSGQPVAVLAASNRAEAESAASLLNDLLDNNLQMYEVKVDGPNVMAKGETLLTLTDADVAAQTSLAPVTPESLAAADAHALQVVLWQYDVTGISADQ